MHTVQALFMRSFVKKNRIPQWRMSLKSLLLRYTDFYRRVENEPLKWDSYQIGDIEPEHDS